MLDISNFPWAECAITENRVMYITDSLSLKRSKRTTNTHRFEFELVTISMNLNEGRGVKAKLSKATDDTLVFVHPRLSYSQGTEPPLGIVLSGSHQIGDTQLTLTSTQAWQLKAGDYIQFSNDTKVYECATDTSLQIGEQTIELTSPLRNTPVGGSQLTVNGVAWHLLSNGSIEISMEASDNQDIQMTLVAVEKL